MMVSKPPLKATSSAAQQKRKAANKKYGISSIENPVIETDHLMSNFDNFYEGVVSSQLVKDKLLAKKKYANCTVLGEGEHVAPDDLTQEALLQSQEFIVAEDNASMGAFGQASALEQTKQQWLPSGNGVGVDTSLTSWREATQQKQFQASPEAIDPALYHDHPQADYNSFVIPEEHSYQQNQLNMTQPLRASSQATKLQNSRMSTQQKLMLQEATKSGSGIVHYTKPLSRGLLVSSAGVSKRAKSGKAGGSRLQAAARTQGQYASVARMLTAQEQFHKGSREQASNKELLSRMLTDDERYRERILKGYLSHLVQAQTTKSSPRKGFSNGLPTSNRNGNFMLSDQQLMYSTRPLIHQHSPDSANNKAALGASKTAYLGDKLGQDYHQASQPDSQLPDLQTMHTSEVNGSKRQFFPPQALQIDCIDSQELAGHQSTAMMRRSKPMTASHADGVRRKARGLKGLRSTGRRRGEAPHGHDQVFKSLEVESNLFKSPHAVDGEGVRLASLNQGRLKQRPMTGAATSGLIHHGHGLAKSMGRRLGPNLYGTAYMTNSNRLSLKEGRSTNNTMTLHTTTKRGVDSGIFTVANSKKHLLKTSARNQSSINFASAHLAQTAQSQATAGLRQSMQDPNRSLGRIGVANVMSVRALSSTQRKFYQMTKPEQLTTQNGGGKNKSRASLNSSLNATFLSATALSQIPPKTNVEVLDTYYENFDTQAQIGTIKFSTEFERLNQQIERFWKLKGTGATERDKVRKVLVQIQTQGEKRDTQESEQRSLLHSMVNYVKLMKEYYMTDANIRNIYQERDKAQKDLVIIAKTFDRSVFKKRGLPLLHKIRMLTVQLVQAVQLWKAIVSRATATFTIENAMQGSSQGRQITNKDTNEACKELKGLKPSSDFTKSSRDSVSTQASFATAGDKFRHKYQHDQIKAEKLQKSAQVCLLCHIRDSSDALQKEGGILACKLALFTTDSILFTAKKSLQAAKDDIERLSNAFPDEKTFTLNQAEVSYYDKFRTSLRSDNKRAQRLVMTSTLDYLKAHICENACSLTATAKPFEFAFDWHQTEAAELQADCQAVVEWQYGDLERSDRISMVYNALYEKMAVQIEARLRKEREQQRRAMGPIVRGQIISSGRQIIVEDASIGADKRNHNQGPQSEGWAPNQQNELVDSAAEMLLYNEDLNEQLIEERDLNQENRALIRPQMASALEPHIEQLSTQAMGQAIPQADYNSGEVELIEEPDQTKSDEKVESQECKTSSDASATVSAPKSASKVDDQEDSGSKKTASYNEKKSAEPEIKGGVALFNHEQASAEELSQDKSSPMREEGVGYEPLQPVEKPTQLIQAYSYVDIQKSVDITRVRPKMTGTTEIFGNISAVPADVLKSQELKTEHQRNLEWFGKEGSDEPRLLGESSSNQVSGIHRNEVLVINENVGEGLQQNEGDSPNSRANPSASVSTKQILNQKALHSRQATSNSFASHPHMIASNINSSDVEEQFYAETEVQPVEEAWRSAPDSKSPSSATIMTDGSPGGFVNHVTIGVRETESQEVIIDSEENSNTEASVGMRGEIQHVSQEGPITVLETNAIETTRGLDDFTVPLHYDGGTKGRYSKQIITVDNRGSSLTQE